MVSVSKTVTTEVPVVTNVVSATVLPEACQPVGITQLEDRHFYSTTVGMNVNVLVLMER